MMNDVERVFFESRKMSEKGFDFMAALFAWNAQKNKMSDVVGKAREQEREGRLKNEDIDSSRSHLNYDLIDDERTLYKRVQSRVQALKENGSRVQKNSVVMYSNVITLPSEMHDTLSKEEEKRYFEVATDYFKNRFGEENVVSAKVHLDETTPHMHLHFIPVNAEGRLSARTAMSRPMMNEMHDQLPAHMREHGFDVVRGDSRDNLYLENVHEFKKQMGAKHKEVEELEKEVDRLKNTNRQMQNLAMSVTLNEYEQTRIFASNGELLPKALEKANEVSPQAYFSSVGDVPIAENTFIAKNDKKNKYLHENQSISYESNNYSKKLKDKGEEKTVFEFLKSDRFSPRLSDEEAVFEALTAFRLRFDYEFRKQLAQTQADKEYQEQMEREIEEQNERERRIRPWENDFSL